MAGEVAASEAPPTGERMLQYRRVTGAIFALLVAMVTWTGAALALEPVSVTGDIDAIDLLPAVQSYSSQGDSINIKTAPGQDGIVRGIQVVAKERGTNPNWIVFALANTG